MHARRLVITAVMVLAWSVLVGGAPLHALDDRSDAINALRTRADRAQPRDRCFLYAKLVNQLTELAGQQFSGGNYDEASATVVLVRQYAEQIHLDVADDGRNLKDAELLMQRSALRFKDILREAPYEDRATLQATLEQLDKVQAQLLIQVFKK